MHGLGVGVRVLVFEDPVVFDRLWRRLRRLRVRMVLVVVEGDPREIGGFRGADPQSVKVARWVAVGV